MQSLTIVALITWLITAVGGFVMLGIWISKGGVRSGNTRFPSILPFGHFLLAAAGLIIWIAYAFLGHAALAWISFVLLLPVAVLGFIMLIRWIPVYRARATASSNEALAEQGFPLPVVIAHGIFAVITVVLVLIVALGF